MSEINTANDSYIAIQGDTVLMLAPRAKWSKEEALRMAAWIVAIADDNDEFEKILEAVRNT